MKVFIKIDNVKTIKETLFLESLNKCILWVKWGANVKGTDYVLELKLIEANQLDSLLEVLTDELPSCTIEVTDKTATDGLYICRKYVGNDHTNSYEVQCEDLGWDLDDKFEMGPSVDYLRNKLPHCTIKPNL